MRRVSGPSIVLAIALLAAACGDGGVGPGRPQSRIDILPDSAPTATLHVGDTIRLMARRLDARGRPLTSDRARFVWSSSDSSVAVVAPDGLTRIVGVGSAEITARVAGAAPGVASTTDTASATVTLRGTPLTIEILPASLATTEYFLGDTVRLRARRVDAAGMPLPDDTVTFSWESSDTAAVLIDAAGLVSFNGIGTSTIRARIADANDPAKPSTLDTLSEAIDLGRVPVVIHPGPVQAGVRSGRQWGGVSGYCVVLADGRAFCRSSSGQWIPLGGELRFTSISTSLNHGCALSVDGRAFCWGRNGHGQLGQGFAGGFAETGGVATEALEVSGGHRWLFIEADGHSHTCGITTDRVPMCVGHNDFGQLGREPRASVDPVLAEWGFGYRLTSLQTDQFTTCGLDAEGAVYCSGMFFGGIVNRIAEPSVFTAIAAGSQHACVLDPAGAAHCWGRNERGQAGTGAFTGDTEMHPVTGGLKFESLDAWLQTSCGVTEGGETWCWGDNDGTFGRRGVERTAVPIKLGVGLGTHSIRESCGIDALSRFVCWGPAEVGPREAVASAAAATREVEHH